MKGCVVTFVLFLAARFAEDGLWQPWTTWTTCSATCGGGQQQRERSCDGVLHGGKNCTGQSFQSRKCNKHECPGTGAGWTLAASSLSREMGFDLGVWVPSLCVERSYIDWQRSAPKASYRRLATRTVVLSD